MKKIMIFSSILLIGLLTACSMQPVDQKPLVNLDEASSTNDGGKTYDDFVATIYLRESDVDPRMGPIYATYYDIPVLEYQKVEAPGRPARDEDGNVPVVPMTYGEYFYTTGVGSIYKVGSEDPEMFRRMQSATVNYLGFVGFQFSESDLWVLGYYEHYDDQGLPTYYVDLGSSAWANGVRDYIMFDTSQNLWVHATDHNTWEGNWLGKHGINSYQDFIDPDKHRFVIDDHFEYKYNNLVRFLARTPGAKSLSYYTTNFYLYWSKLHPKAKPPKGYPDRVPITLSGLLAGAHLRGAQGVVNLLVDGTNAADENGTYILEYVQKFAGYKMPNYPNPSTR